MPPGRNYLARRLDERPPALWSRHDLPRYLEAYPVVRIGEAHRRSHSGETHVLWWDEGGQIAAVAATEWDGRDRFRIRSSVDLRNHLTLSDDEAEFEIAWKGSADNNQRPFARCPRCARHVDGLVFAGAWLCARCFGLRNRSAFLPVVVRLTEQLTELEGRLALDALSDRRRARLEIERDRLSKKLRGRSLSANSLYQVVLQAEWVQPLVKTGSRLPPAQKQLELFNSTSLEEALDTALSRSAKKILDWPRARRQSPLRIKRDIVANMQLPVPLELGEPYLAEVTNPGAFKPEPILQIPYSGNPILWRMSAPGWPGVRPVEGSFSDDLLSLATHRWSGDTKWLPAVYAAQLQAIRTNIARQRAVIERFEKKRVRIAADLVAAFASSYRGSKAL